MGHRLSISCVNSSGPYRMRAYLSFIHHKSSEIICIPNVTILTLFDTIIGYEDLQLLYSKSLEMNQPQAYNLTKKNWVTLVSRNYVSLHVVCLRSHLTSCVRFHAKNIFHHQPLPQPSRSSIHSISVVNLWSFGFILHWSCKENLLRRVWYWGDQITTWLGLVPLWSSIHI